MENIKKWWPNFLNFIKAKRKMVWMNLQHLSVESAADNMVVLGYTARNGSNKSLLEKDKSFISSQLSEFCGKNVGLSFVKADNGTDNNFAPQNGFSTQNAADFLQHHPEIKRLNDLLDGDIIGFKGSS